MQNIKFSKEVVPWQSDLLIYKNLYGLKQKIFDGRENEWREEEHMETTWSSDDPTMPDWLRKHIK